METYHLRTQCRCREPLLLVLGTMGTLSKSELSGGSMLVSSRRIAASGLLCECSLTTLSVPCPGSTVLLPQPAKPKSRAVSAFGAFLGCRLDMPVLEYYVSMNRFYPNYFVRGFFRDVCHF